MNRSLLFAGLFVLGSTFGVQAQGSEFEPPKKSDPTLEAIQKQLLDIQISLQSLKAQDTEVRLRKLEIEIAGIRDQLKSLEATVKASKVETRTAASINPPAATPSPTGIVPVAQFGTIRVSNSSAFFASFILNGSLYRVAPGQVLPISNQPVGEFRYEVVADGFGTIQAPLTRTLGAGEVVSIFIYPR